MTELNHDSSKVQLLRVAATVLKVAKTWRRCLDKISTMELTAAELKEAEKLWINSVQTQSFESDLTNLRNPRFPSTKVINQLGLFLDEDSIIR